MWIRVLTAGLVSIATMGGLYGLLFGLVEATAKPSGTVIAHRIDFRPVLVDSTVQSNRPVKPERKPTETPPDTPPIAIAAVDLGTSGPPTIERVALGGGGIEIGRTELGTVAGFDHAVIPLVRIQP